MSSTASRGQIVTDALSLAGRSQELKQSCNQWLNYALLDIGLTFRFPELRKFGSATSLAAGACTAPLPADIGAGMEKSGMIFGPDNKPLNEMSYEEFINTRGMPVANATGRPQFYIVDLNSQVFRFDKFADAAYAYTPVYFEKPPLLPVDTSYDNQPVWIDNDRIAIEALKWWIWVFTDDERQKSQEIIVEKLCIKWQREVVKLGGTSRVLPSPSRFKGTNYQGFGGFNGP